MRGATQALAAIVTATGTGLIVLGICQWDPDPIVLGASLYLWAFGFGFISLVIGGDYE